MSELLTTSDLLTFLNARLDEDEAYGRSEECGYQQDPARVLREVEAKRRIIDGWDPIDHPTTPLYVLAAIYRDHPDYDPAWNLWDD